ncbi:A24 family peptidase [Comamonas testosteroni]|uniref:A24 family peptidase n=1 Tax=Comamonas testosteroni TaxID=285 RepID=UPI0005B4188B|nr:A24 family peptidase [Comamonas testosteroni]
MTSSELSAASELMAGLFTEPRSLVLMLLLLAASISDLRTRRIPNRLTFGGIALALLYGLLAPHPHGGGFFWALGGMALGLAMMLPLYLLHAMGGGDVKLMAMVGSFIGPEATWQAVIFVFITGGVAAIGYALWHRMAGKLLRNSAEAVQLLYINVAAGIAPDARSSSAHSVGKLPYGVSIALGTLAFLVARQFTWV